MLSLGKRWPGFEVEDVFTRHFLSATVPGCPPGARHPGALSLQTALQGPVCTVALSY